MTSICFQKNFQRAFGTWPLKGRDATDAVLIALETGYRAIDTAQMYHNELEVGIALHQSGIPRDELCVVTKVHPDNYTEALFLRSVERSLKDMRLDRVDILLLHWPPVGGAVEGPLALLQTAVDRGLASHIGVSNFTAAMMRTAAHVAKSPIVTNQVEFHPLLNQDILLAAALETGIPLSSYSSVARGEVFKHAIFAEIGLAYNKSAAQVVLRWILQKGVSINTMSSKRDNIRANYDIMDFTLSSIDMARIEELTRLNYRIGDLRPTPWNPVWD